MQEEEGEGKNRGDIASCHHEKEDVKGVYHLHKGRFLLDHFWIMLVELNPSNWMQVGPVAPVVALPSD
ncbi:hypothetical protein STEG23_013697 [Scotinomys teguina]